MVEHARRTVGVWRWNTGEPIPDATLVVCSPGLFDSGPTWPGGRTIAEAAGRGSTFICAGEWDPKEVGGLLVEAGGEIIPARHVRRQEDLADLSRLLAVQAARHGLLVEPMDSIDLRRVFYEMGHIDRRTMEWVSEGSVRRVRRVRPDIVVVAGFDDWLRPEHVREVVNQCRDAQVPVIFAGWGEWLCWSQVDMRDPAWRAGATRLMCENRTYYALGRARSGCLLDGVEVCDMPDWLGRDERH